MVTLYAFYSSPLHSSQAHLIFQQGTDWVPLVIVGNKCDLRPDQRHVSEEEGNKLAAEFKCSFTEASARLNTNVAKAFEQMIGEIEKASNPNEPTGGSKCMVM